MSRNNRNFQPPQKRENALTMSDDALVMTEEDLEAQTRPDNANTGDLSDDDSSAVIHADDVVDDPSATGIVDEEIPGELVTIEDIAPEVPQIDLKAEEMKERANALRQFRVMPRKTQRLRVPHPQGRGAMWLNLTAGKTMTVPKYVRDHLWEKGLL